MCVCVRGEGKQEKSGSHIRTVTSHIHTCMDTTMEAGVYPHATICMRTSSSYTEHTSEHIYTYAHTYVHVWEQQITEVIGVNLAF